MQPADVLSRPARPPDLALNYGPEGQPADLWLPPDDAEGPAQLILFLHGGFWRRRTTARTPARWPRRFRPPGSQSACPSTAG
jgi:acetyl esterase/lipase